MPARAKRSNAATAITTATDRKPKAPKTKTDLFQMSTAAAAAAAAAVAETKLILDAITIAIGVWFPVSQLLQLIATYAAPFVSVKTTYPLAAKSEHFELLCAIDSEYAIGWSRDCQLHKISVRTGTGNRILHT